MSAVTSFLIFFFFSQFDRSFIFSFFFILFSLPILRVLRCESLVKFGKSFVYDGRVLYVFIVRRRKRKKERRKEKKKQNTGVSSLRVFSKSLSFGLPLSRKYTVTHACTQSLSRQQSSDREIGSPFTSDRRKRASRRPGEVARRLLLPYLIASRYLVTTIAIAVFIIVDRYTTVRGRTAATMLDTVERNRWKKKYWGRKARHPRSLTISFRDPSPSFSARACFVFRSAARKRWSRLAGERPKNLSRSRSRVKARDDR